jgi:hypothetical protein
MMTSPTLTSAPTVHLSIVWDERPSSEYLQMWRDLLLPIAARHVAKKASKQARRRAPRQRGGKA